MKKILIILLGVVIINNLAAQNTMDKLGLSASTPAASAYSLRLLSTGYSGAAIRVRRSSDNTTQDIGFLSGVGLDTASLKTFVTTGNGYITTWYDQSGNGRNLTQGTVSRQPAIVSNGIVYRRNGSPAAFHDNSDDGLRYTGANYLTSTPLSVNIVAGSNSNSTQLRRAVQGTNNWLVGPYSNLHSWYASGWNHQISTPWSTTNAEIFTVIEPAATTNTSWRNGISQTSANNKGVPLVMNTGVEGAYAEPMDGFISEILAFNSELDNATRQIIEANQAAQYFISSSAIPPVIFTQPSTTNQTYCKDAASTALNVSTSGSAFQWYRNTTNSNTGGTIISGAISNTYTPSTSVEGTSYYYVEISGSGGPAVTSNVSGAITIPVQLNATVNTVNPTCLLPGTITISNPISESNTFINSDFSSVPANATLSGSTVISGGECILTPAASGQNGFLSFAALSSAPAVFTAVFDYRVADGSGADGTSFNYGVLSPAGKNYESGIVSSGLVVRMIEYGSQRVEVNYNGTNLVSVGVTLINTSYRTCIITITGANQLTMSIGGTNIISNLALPAGYATADKSTWQFAFASRCGGANNKHSIKNLSIAGSLLQYSIDGSTWQSGTSFSVPGGVYTVKMQLANSSVCNLRDIATITLVAPVGPVAGVSGTTSGYDSVTLTASGGVTYNWTGGTSLNTAANSFTKSGAYKVVVTDGNGCTDSITSNITIYLSGLTRYGGITTDSLLQLDKTGAIATATKVDRYGKTRSASGPDGTSAVRAGTSAYQIKQDFPASADGIYWIQNSNINSGTPFRIYADMTTDGGGWTLIMCNVSPNPGWSNAQALLRNETSPGISSTYSIIAWADYIKKSSSGFQYMMDAQTRRTNGAIWTANSNYSFVSTSNTNTNITLNTKFGTWNYADQDIEARMPWYAPGSQGIITTSADANGNWWGTLIAASGWTPAPWLGSSTQNPGIIWYWVR